ncbi:MAG TPA: hypothetical protein DCP52_01365 [Elusimicrobia bacterium]|nr:hypothetical protein [Elusimicrobiota bacterium]
MTINQDPHINNFGLKSAQANPVFKYHIARADTLAGRTIPSTLTIHTSRLAGIVAPGRFAFE